MGDRRRRDRLGHRLRREHGGERRASRDRARHVARRQRVAVDREWLPHHAERAAAAWRCTGRRARPEARVRGRAPLVRRRIAAVRRGAELSAAHRGQARARCGRCPARADEPGLSRHGIRRGGPERGDRTVGGMVGGFDRRGAPVRRCARRLRLLAMGVRRRHSAAAGCGVDQSRAHRQSAAPCPSAGGFRGRAPHQRRPGRARVGADRRTRARSYPPPRSAPRCSGSRS